jgi:hypothetical protein
MFNSRKTLPLLLTTAIVCTTAQADDYRFELGLSGDHVNVDLPDEPDANLEAFGISGTFYLKPVPTDGVPLAEAAFLNRSSYINAGLVGFDGGRGDEFDIFYTNFGYYIPNTMFYGRIGLIKADDDLGADDDTLVNGSVGVAPIDGLLVTTNFDEDGWDPNVSARYVGKFGNDHFYAATVSVTDSDDENVDVGLAFDYFLDHTFSVGGSVSSDLLEVRAEKFFWPNFAVGGRVYSNDDLEGDGLAATVKWRF